MREEFLYYIWENRLTDKDLKTAEGETVEVVATGYRNTDSGPDFLEYAYEMKKPIYNFDCAAGILYEVTDTNPMGERISILGMADGTPFDMEKTYNVVMNSYRSMGGGNHLINGIGWAQEDIKNHVVWQSDRDLRSLFIDWARNKGVLDSEPLNCWKIK